MFILFVMIVIIVGCFYFLIKDKSNKRVEYFELRNTKAELLNSEKSLWRDVIEQFDYN